MLDQKKKMSPVTSHAITAVIAVFLTFLFMTQISPVATLKLAGVKKTRHQKQSQASLNNQESSQKEKGDFGEIWQHFDYHHPLQDVFAGKTDLETYNALGRFLDVYMLIKDEYYRELTDKEMLDIMLKGLCNEQDSQYTFYLSPEENERVKESNSGEYSGIGAIVQKKDNFFQISDLVDNSPAAKSGLRIGDQFISVDGEEVQKFTDVSQLAAAVRGEKGTSVVIVVYRPSEQKEYTFKIKRESIKNANLRAEYLGDGIGYIRIVEFNSGVYDNFVKAYEEQEKEGAQAYIIDLRNNPGGYVREVTQILDYILPDGVLATARGRRDGEAFSEEWKAEDHRDVGEDVKFYVLVNEYSASASELMSGVLQDYGRAVIIGRQTWGKGVGSVTFDLDDGAGVQVTNFHYYLPKGVCIQDEGISPDIVIDLSDEIKGLPVSQIPRDKDLDLQKALELAREDLSKK